MLPRRLDGLALRIAASGEPLDLGPVAARSGSVLAPPGLPDAAHVDLQAAQLDSVRLIVMRFSPGGELASRELVTDSQAATEHGAWWNLAVSYARPAGDLAA